MSQPTIRQRLSALLIKDGFNQRESRSSKYLTFVHPDCTSGDKLFVGKAGALRCGKSVSESFSNEHIRDCYLAGLYKFTITVDGRLAVQEIKQ